MISLPIGRGSAEIHANTTLNFRDPDLRAPAFTRQLILMMMLAASKAAANLSPSRQGDRQGSVATCKPRANYLNPKEIPAWPVKTTPAAF
jgi:hypothetical protein